MRNKGLLLVVTLVTVLLSGCDTLNVREYVNSFTQHSTTNTTNNKNFSIEYDGGYQEIVVNDNIPEFTSNDLSFDKGVWQTFSDLDQLNRVGVANALIGTDSLPKEERLPRLKTNPTAWKQKRIGPGVNDWLYNRSHLIGYQLTGENDNPMNLMTGTRSLNTPHMLNYENQVKSYIENTGNHVRYRVTPVFKRNELLARGVQLEAKSIEDHSFQFNVYIYNIQKGYELDYATGKSKKI